MLDLVPFAAAFDGGSRATMPWIEEKALVDKPEN